VIRLLIGLLVAGGILFVGVRVIAFMFRSGPPSVPAGQMRKVNMHYRCGVCGAELRLTLAASETPEPPRHCMEEMEPYELEL
jgi:hypothetical protein